MSAPVVTTRKGKISGKAVKLEVEDAKPINVYRNIPFGKPPVGELRFMAPQPADSWDGIKDGTVVGNLPMYPTAFDAMLSHSMPMPTPDDSKAMTNEDCLHLTVYAPQNDGKKKLPVMFYIYGGGFAFGSEKEVDGSVLAALNDVIVVVGNYRVGVFGFLSLGPHSSCPGNAGLMDQQLSLKWVQDNIDEFGGDKNNVTIFGESAGAMSVQYHITSPLSRGLFHKAISHSGQISHPGFCHTAESISRLNAKLFEKLEIKEKDDEKILNAMQNIPTDKLVNVHQEMMMARYTFVPIIDGKIVPKSPSEMMKEGNFAKVPYIIGVNNTEGYGVSVSFHGEAYKKGFSEELAKMSMPLPMTDKGFEECKKFYSGDTKDVKRFNKLVGGSLSDAMMWKAVESAVCHSEKTNADVFLYLGAFRLKMHHDPEFAPKVGKKFDECICDHGDDVYMTFGLPFIPDKFSVEVNFTDEEKKISRNFMTYLTNFAKTGNPNKGTEVEEQWPKYQDNKEHLIIKNPFSVGKNLAEKESKFWSEKVQPHILTMFM